jgi:hypothetical protein
MRGIAAREFFVELPHELDLLIGQLGCAIDFTRFELWYTEIGMRRFQCRQFNSSMKSAFPT